MMTAIGLVYAYVVNAFDFKGRRYMNAAILCGLVLSFVILYFRQYTNMYATGLWNLRIFTASGIFFLTLIVFVILTSKFTETGRIGVCISAAALTALIMAYYMPAFLMLPHTAMLTEKSVLSSSFLLKFIGMLFGLILTFVLGLSSYKGSLRSGKTHSLIYMLAVLALNTVKYLGLSFGIMLARRLIKSNHTLFVFSKNVTNYSDWFTYAIIVICLVMQGIIFFRSLTYNEPYINPAEHRKIIAKWRRARRWSVTALVCAVISVCTMTVIDYYANRPVELSPMEDAAKLDDRNMYISFEQVSDGALHRFGYTTEDGITVRFIVIKKPNSSAYGVGLDACDICGETGYYQRGTQVVCNLCDVVMNINTIGFKGGCNPIIIDYSIADGYIVVPYSTLIEHKSEFK